MRRNISDKEVVTCTKKIYKKPMLFILDIPISAQVVSVADVYDALTSDRVYKRAFSHEKAMQMILDGECGQFNPVLLQCLVNIQDRIKAGLD